MTASKCIVERENNLTVLGFEVTHKTLLSLAIGPEKLKIREKREMVRREEDGKERDRGSRITFQLPLN